jgi:hypothetical protein
MFLNKKGQMGPQALEDLPMVIMAFIVGIASIIIFLDITSAHLTETHLNDMHDNGKRLVETLSGETFKSSLSRAYGNKVLDGALIEKTHQENPQLRDLLGAIEYSFWAKIQISWKKWEFGEDPPENGLVYGGTATVLLDGSLYNAEILVKIWRN